MHPTLFHLPTPMGALAVRSFGVCLAVSVLFGWYLVRRDPRLATELAGRLYFLTVVVALLGARTLHLLVVPRAVRGPFDVLAFGDGGLVAFGGLLAVVALVPRARALGRSGQLELPAREFADALALPGLVAGVLLSLGDYLAGASFGRVLPAAAPRVLRALGTFPRAPVHEGELGRFPDGPPVWTHHLDAFPERLADTAAWSLPTHPVQLYEGALFALFALALVGLSRRGLGPGKPTLFALAAYALVRLVTDPFRGDPERVTLGVASLPTVLATALLVATVAVLARVLHAERAARSASAA